MMIESSERCDFGSLSEGCLLIFKERREKRYQAQKSGENSGGSWIAALCFRSHVMPGTRGFLLT